MQEAQHVKLVIQENTMCSEVVLLGFEKGSPTYKASQRANG